MDTGISSGLAARTVGAMRRPERAIFGPLCHESVPRRDRGTRLTRCSRTACPIPTWRATPSPPGPRALRRRGLTMKPNPGLGVAVDEALPRGQLPSLLAVQAKAIRLVAQAISGPSSAKRTCLMDLDLEIAPVSRVIEALTVLIHDVDGDGHFPAAPDTHGSHLLVTKRPRLHGHLPAVRDERVHLACPPEPVIALFSRRSLAPQSFNVDHSYRAITLG